MGRFQEKFYMKNETLLELFNFYGILHFILTKMYLNQYKQNKNDSINNNNDDNSKNDKDYDGNTIIIIIIIVIIIIIIIVIIIIIIIIVIIIINSLFQPGDFFAGSATDILNKLTSFHLNIQFTFELQKKKKKHFLIYLFYKVITTKRILTLILTRSRMNLQTLQLVN